MIVTIHKGHHSANILQRLRQLGIFRNKKIMERVVEFDITAKYDLGNSDNEDVNKLFGWGYINGGHHEDSVRFGWNWNNETSRVKLWAYCYINGTRSMIAICEIRTHTKVLCTIEKLEASYVLTVRDALNTYFIHGEARLGFLHNKKWAYALGPFFGGNNPAPHDITIKISKK